MNEVDIKRKSASSIALYHYLKGGLRLVKLLLRCPKAIFSNADQVSYIRKLLKESIPTCCLSVEQKLVTAAWIGDFRAIRGLLQCPGSETNINTLDEKGRTPMYIASMVGHLNAIKVLLTHANINPNIGLKFDGGTAFSIASKKSRFEIMKKLISHEKTDVSRGWCKDNWAKYASLSQS